MAKNSTKPRATRRPTDGAPRLDTVSPILIQPAPTASEGETISFLLTGVQDSLLGQVVIGETVTFATQASTIAVLGGIGLIGYVPANYHAAVQAIIRGEHAAWISDVFDKGVEVTVQRP